MLLLGSLLFISSCRKKEVDLQVIDLSTGLDEQYAGIYTLGKTTFLVGGSRWSHSAIYQLDSFRQLSRIDLSLHAYQKGLYGIDGNSNGILAAVGYEGQVYYSSDSGKIWTQILHRDSREYQDVAVSETNQACIVGGISFNKGFLLQTPHDQNPPTSAFDLRSFELCDVDRIGSTYYACGYGVVLKSANGMQWDFSSAENDYFKSMTWYNENKGWVAGYQGTILSTEDGGMQWNKLSTQGLPSASKRHILGIHHFNTQRLAICGEQGFLAYTINGGSTWKTAKPFTSSDLHAVQFLNEQELITCGKQGTIFLVKMTD